MSKLEDYILEFPGLIHPKSLSQLIRYCNTDIKFETARTAGGVMKEIRNAQNYTLHNVCSDHKDEKMTQILWHNFLRKLAGETAVNYNNRLGTSFTFNSLLEVTILKYEKGGFYKPHVDDSQMTPRRLSGILFLNNDYEGGELHFLTPDKSKVIKVVKPEPGKFVWWPACALYPHTATPVTKGTRYVIVSWC